SPDGKTLAMSLTTGPIHFVDVESGKILGALPRDDAGNALSVPSGLLWWPHGKSLVFGDAQHIRHGEVATPKLLHTHELAATTRLKWTQCRNIISVMWSKNGRL